jgi:hypothetical protein
MANPQTPEQAEKLRQLYAAHAKAVQKATDALRTGGKPLEAEALRRAIDADAEVGAIARQIKELIG